MSASTENSHNSWPHIRQWYREKLVYRLPSAAALAVAAWLPSDGIGITACLSQAIFSVSCPACGLTRSLSSLLHFDFSKSVDYHPLGGLILPLLLLFTVTNRLDIPENLTILPAMVRKYLTGKTLAILFTAVWLLN